MAASTNEITQCLSNLKLGCTGNDTERSERFWNASIVELKFGVEKLWLDAVSNSKEKPNLGMRNLDPILEERAGFNLELVGPMIDSYFGEIGRGIAAKLGRSRCTGLMPPLRLFVPYVVFRHLCNIIVGYGGWLTSTKDRMSVVVINTTENAEKVFSLARFQGKNFLKKRHFEKVMEMEGKYFNTREELQWL